MQVYIRLQFNMHRQPLTFSGHHLRPDQFYGKSNGKAIHEVIAITNDESLDNSFVTGKLAYYILSSILAIGILVSFLVVVVSVSR